MTEQAVSSEIASLLERLEGQEALDLEFKAARGGLPQSLWPTMSAFANTRGGWIVLGIAERDGQLVAEGVARPQEMLQQLSDQIRNPQRISYPVSGATHLSVEHVADREVVVVRVPPAPRRVRPVYVDRNPYDGTYVRRHTGDYRCTRPEVDRMMREAADLTIDRVIPSGYDWSDLDRGAFARYRRRYQTNAPDSPWNSYDDEAFLQAIGGFRRDRETGQCGITVAGLLMFGTDEAIREWRGRHMIDFRVVPGDPTERLDVRWTDRIVWEGNLLGAFEKIYPRLVADLPVPFALADGLRVDQSPRHVALREALINLLVHADYRETDVSLIVRSDRGYLFRNPGDSRVIDPDLDSGDRSDPRNPELVRMFRLVGLAEEAGTGIPKIVQAWRELGFQRPDFDTDGERYEFTVHLRYAHLLSEDDRRWLDGLGWPWTEAEQLALVIARHEGWVDNATLRRVTGQHPADVTRVLGGLRDSGVLQMVGGGRGARYQLDPQLSTAVSPPSSTAGEELSTTGEELSTADSAPSTAGLEPASATNKVDPTLEQALVRDPIWRTLEEIARPVSAVDFIGAQLRDDIIVRLCSVRPLSLLELTWLLRRDKPYLRTILRHLIDTGRLVYRYPDRPRHPQQRYLAANAPNSPAAATI